MREENYNPRLGAYFTALSLSYGGVIISVALYILSKRVGDDRRDRVGDGRQRKNID